MTDQRKEDEFDSEAEIAQLLDEQAEMKVLQEAVISQLKELRAKEDPLKGVHFAQDIFRLSQEKLRLAAEIDYRSRKVNRLRMSADG